MNLQRLENPGTNLLKTGFKKNKIEHYLHRLFVELLRKSAVFTWPAASFLFHGQRKDPRVDSISVGSVVFRYAPRASGSNNLSRNSR